MAVQAPVQRNIPDEVDDDDGPIIFRRSNTSKQNQLNSEIKMSAFQRHDGQSERQVAGEHSPNDQSSLKSKVVPSAKASPMKSPLANPKASTSSARTSPMRSPVPNSTSSHSLDEPKHSSKQTISTDVKEETEANSDSEDDKPLSTRLSTGTSKGNSNNVNQGRNMPTPNLSLPSKPKISVKKSDEDSDDEVHLSARFSSKSNVGTSDSRPYDSDEKKLLASKLQQNGSTTRNNIEGKSSILSRKRPLDKPNVSNQLSSTKKPKLMDTSTTMKVKQVSVKAELKAEVDDDDMPISQRIKKTITSNSKSSSTKQNVTKVVSSSFKKTTNNSKEAAKNSKYSKSTKVPPGSGDGQKKWTTLAHNSVIFPPPYMPHGIKILYNGKPVDLTPKQEEVATMFAVMKEIDYFQKEKFRENFFTDWRKLLGKNHVIQNLDKCDFTPIYDWYQKEKEKKKQLSTEDLLPTTVSRFIVDDINDNLDDGAKEDGFDGKEDSSDTVCAFCDNGRDVLCCAGKCLRSFHATIEAGKDSGCVSLGFSDGEAETMQNFVCRNCESNQHQYFFCGKLGSSDKNSDVKVFRCSSASCGHYYHPHCVAKLLHPENEVTAEELRKEIASGKYFTCPVHKCYVCKQVHNDEDPELQFAVCRRCPKSYHRKCLPRKIAFEDKEEEGIIQRAWGRILRNRILIYCLKHEIDDNIGTPTRDHIIFPDIEGQETTIEENNKKLASETTRTEKFLSKKRSLASEDSIWGRTAVKLLKHDDNPSSAMKGNKTTKRIKKVSHGLDSSKKVKLYASLTKGSEPVKSWKDDDLSKTPRDKLATKKLSFLLPALDADSERRILALVRDSASLITLEEIIEKRKVPSTHVCSSKNVVDKSITMGKVETAVEAVRIALQKLDEGSSIEDAKAICEPEILHQIVKWKNKLEVYLAPFLRGMRYSSFGRHFTKVEKLEEIVEKLHWYVGNGDMIVDFCCGANDFSCLMKKKLDETGKKCSYKNYDILQPKNDFSFEKRDWMTVEPKELPNGSQLIMGLNPPFGVKAALANKFINKALEFNPKLLVLIVPPETKRLDKKNPPYDLVWEDDKFLSGKSFYLPGSVDVNDKQMEQWNVNPPVLYLWSRCDLTSKHTAIGQKHGHLSRRKQSFMGENHNGIQIPYGTGGRESHERHPHLELSMSGLERQFGTSYSMITDEVYSSMTDRMRESADSPGYRPYIGRVEEKAVKDLELRSQVRLSGQQDPAFSTQRSKYLADHVPGYGQMGPMPSMSCGRPGSAAVNTSTMQRYTPQLDELKHTRKISFWFNSPMVSRNGSYDPIAPRPEYFAPGPNSSYSRQNSSGWLDD